MLTIQGDDIAYFRLPGGTTTNVPFVIQMLADSLCKMNLSKIKGWIIDLRLNTGGNIWFMLPPLAGLLGDGPIGGIHYLNGQPPTTTSIREGKVGGNGQWYQVPENSCVIGNAQVPVVVLVGPKTASSAEGVMLAFKGRPNTLILGEPTAGLVTSNNTFTLRPGINLVLATGYMQDRNRQYYTTALEPDMLVTGGDNFISLLKDQKIIQARVWLYRKLGY